jgi:hypothetical protein
MKARKLTWENYCALFGRDLLRRWLAGVAGWTN